jgi:hypothetical protein
MKLLAHVQSLIASFTSPAAALPRNNIVAKRDADFDVTLVLGLAIPLRCFLVVPCYTLSDFI